MPNQHKPFNPSPENIDRLVRFFLLLSEMPLEEDRGHESGRDQKPNLR